MLIGKIKNWFKKLWRVEYRLSVWTSRGNLYHFKAPKRQTVFNDADFVIIEGFNTCTWTLYKSGRFMLPEREIQRSTDNLKH